MRTAAPPTDPRQRLVAGSDHLPPAETTAVQIDAAPRDAASMVALVVFAAYVAISLAGVGGRLLTVTYPAACLLVGLLTYVRSRTSYLAFVWWLWLLTPFVRRVFDLHYGFHPTSPLLLGPLLASGVAVLTVIRRFRMLRSSAYVPFLVAGAALAYAFLIGLIRQSVAAATYDLLTWIAPLVFGMHLALEWRRFPVTRKAITSNVLWGLLLTSAYAVAQFIDPPLWDRVWVVSAEMASVGAPMPFLIRVFSTLNAPGPFSVMLVFALLIGLASPQRWRFVALALGLVALVLTKGRSAWGAFLLGAVVMQLRQPLRSLPRQWIALLAVLMLAAPVITQPRVMSVLTRRAATLRNVEQDYSFKNRVTFTRFAISNMSANPAGWGLGYLGGASKLLRGSKAGFALDSGPLEIYSVMGWLGGTLFMLALAAIILPIARSRRVRFEPVTSAAVSVVVALIFASFFGNIFNSVSGFFFWSAVGLATAGRTYAGATDLLQRYAGHSELLARALPRRPTAA
ncbi:MAG TPA: O-antigen ligase family protein [Gemmatimonadaceae bacterium]